ncbi:hypothetical protein GcM1_114004 [Golovinomyces cichoracearum]|uniref:ARS-binding protein 1 N-terminal domain-containing protein n=1 Tax=Golovinomyces cichoracearum TaxID=62708 RepID=A0A420JC66_9PEZI|nr:hypothetical protein GcM1_114004 [Golovinomyces cichoracearum]
MAGGPRLIFEQKHRICKQESKHPLTSQANLAKWVKTQCNLEDTPNRSMISRRLANQKIFEQKVSSELIKN